MALNKLEGLSGLNTLDGLGGGSGSGGAIDLTPEELVLIAKSRGGAVGQVADELAHPEKSILSTIGQGFKNAFSGFVDIISKPSQVVAGILSPNLTIEEAIKEKKRVSDVVFGDSNIFNKDGENSTLMQRIGDFVVRLPVDILSDPLTYVTFGASAGAMGLRSLSKISLGEKAIESAGLIGKNKKTYGAVSKALSEGVGTDTYKLAQNLTKKIELQMNGKLSASNLNKMKKLDEVGEGLRNSLLKEGGLSADDLKFIDDFTETEVKSLLKSTIDSPLNMDYAKKTVSNLLEHNPALTKTLLDKGGIKFMGKTILSSQRLSSVISSIPLMSKLDELTLPFRNSIASRFDGNLVRTIDSTGNNFEYIRYPEEFINAKKQMSDLSTNLNTDLFQQVKNIQDTVGLNENEWRDVMSSLNVRKIPVDQKGALAYEKLLGIQDEWKDMLGKAGVSPSLLDNYVGNWFVNPDTKRLMGSSTFGVEPGATMYAQNSKFIQQSGQNVSELVPSLGKIIEPPKIVTDTTGAVVEQAPKIKNVLDYSDDFKTAVKDVKSPQEVGFAIGKETDRVWKELEKAGLSVEQRLSHPQIKSLQKLRTEVDGQVQNAQFIGKAESLGLEAEKIDDVYTNMFTDKDGNVYKRFATSAVELENAGFKGFDTNLLTSYTMIGLRNQRQALGQHFMEGMLRNFAKRADEAPDGWVAIDNAGLKQKGLDIGMPLVDKDGVAYVFHPGVAKGYEKMMENTLGDELTEGFWKSFDKIQSYWKSSVTAIFPMFHGRNAISNVFLNFMDLGYHSFNPATHGMSMDMIYKDRIANGLMKRMGGAGDDAIKATKEFQELMNTPVFTDAIGYEWSYGELRETVKKYNIAFNKNITGAADIYNDKNSLMGIYGIGKSKKQQLASKLNPTSQQNIAFQGGREVGRAIEEQARLVNFITNLRNTGDVSHAANRTKMFLFDYGNLTNFEKSVLRRMIPFYSFTRFNLEMQAKALVQAPGRIATELKIVNSIGDIMGGEELTDKEFNLLPVWMKNSIAFKRKNKEGNTELISGFGTPIEQPFQALQKNGLLGSVSPIVRYPIEALTGYQWFRGKPTSDVIDARNFKDAPELLKQYIGYSEYEGFTKSGEKYRTYVSLRPERMNLINNLPVAGRILGLFGDLSSDELDTSTKALKAITGIQAKEFNFSAEEDRKQKELMTKLESLLEDAGVRGKFTRFYTKKNTTQISD